MMTEAIIESSGNVFLDLGFSNEEATLLEMRSSLMIHLEKLIHRYRWTQTEAAQYLNIRRSLVSDLMHGRWEKFSLDMLLALAVRAGLHPQLALDPVAA